MKRMLLMVIILASALVCRAQDVHELTIDCLPGEYWWGASVGNGHRMPFTTEFGVFDLERDNANNQVVPLLLSSHGRWLWSDRPFSFRVTGGGTIEVKSRFEPLAICCAADPTLRGAYLEACRKHFPPAGTLPDELFFAMPQYNTWIELMYDQNQGDILRYARGVIDNGFPPGVLMIDDNWQKHYGNFDFKPDRFPDPRAMVDSLHAMGFRVMVWVCPFVSPDSPEYRDLAARGYLIKRRGGGPAVFGWWNGQSACYDMTNPAAADHFVQALKGVQERYGIDGFKFDAGDNGIYYGSKTESYQHDALSVDHTQKWAEVGLHFPFNEYRACWKMGGQPLVQRLGDKNYSWDAVRTLIPDMTAAGLLGYAYTCPDMIGGGQFATFLNVSEDSFDQEQIVRSAQTHALMPMMQFSVAPWRILNDENLAIVREAALLHERFGVYILECAREASRSGEPVVRHMAYAFPGEGFEECRDQFMLGDRYLVAPMVERGTARTVKLPRGTWRDDTGKRYRGGRTVTLDVPLSRLPWFEKL